MSTTTFFPSTVNKCYTIIEFEENYFIGLSFLYTFAAGILAVSFTKT
jgi:hypothetical protein